MKSTAASEGLTEGDIPPRGAVAVSRVVGRALGMTDVCQGGAGQGSDEGRASPQVAEAVVILGDACHDDD